MFAPIERSKPWDLPENCLHKKCRDLQDVLTKHDLGKKWIFIQLECSPAADGRDVAAYLQGSTGREAPDHCTAARREPGTNLYCVLLKTVPSDNISDLLQKLHQDPHPGAMYWSARLLSDCMDFYEMNVPLWIENFKGRTVLPVPVGAKVLEEFQAETARACALEAECREERRKEEEIKLQKELADFVPETPGSSI